MKQRVLVMNGQRLVQSEIDNEWVVTKVGKAGSIKPGIYNISTAITASKDQTYDGVVLHADQEHVYQQVGKTCVRHSAHDFPKVPDIGTNTAIRYDADQASASQTPTHQGRGLRR
jgi:cell filamentation protein